jgi:hypothetical protein
MDDLIQHGVVKMKYVEFRVPVTSETTSPRETLQHKAICGTHQNRGGQTLPKQNIHFNPRR